MDDQKKTDSATSARHRRRRRRDEDTVEKKPALTSSDPLIQAIADHERQAESPRILVMYFGRRPPSILKIAAAAREQGVELHAHPYKDVWFRTNSLQGGPLQLFVGDHAIEYFDVCFFRFIGPHREEASLIAQYCNGKLFQDFHFSSFSRASAREAYVFGNDEHGSVRKTNGAREAGDTGASASDAVSASASASAKQQQDHVESRDVDVFTGGRLATGNVEIEVSKFSTEAVAGSLPQRKSMSDQRKQVVLVNPMVHELRFCTRKSEQMMRLQMANVPIPNSVVGAISTLQRAETVEALGGFPFIVKTSLGSFGRSVHKVVDQEGLRELCVLLTTPKGSRTNSSSSSRDRTVKKSSRSVARMAVADDKAECNNGAEGDTKQSKRKSSSRIAEKNGHHQDDDGQGDIVGLPSSAEDGDGHFRTSSGELVVVSEEAEVPSKGRPVIAQEYVPNTCDYRVFVLGNEVLGAIRRSAQSEGEFRHNVALGAMAEEVCDLPQSWKEIAVRASKACNCLISGVDILARGPGVFDGPLVLEVNTTPMFRGFQRATGIDVSAKMVEFLCKYYKTVTGYKRLVQTATSSTRKKVRKRLTKDSKGSSNTFKKK